MYEQSLSHLQGTRALVYPHLELEVCFQEYLSFLLLTSTLVQSLISTTHRLPLDTGS